MQPSFIKFYTEFSNIIGVKVTSFRSLCRAHFFGSPLYGLNDIMIARAAADIAF